MKRATIFIAVQLALWLSVVAFKAEIAQHFWAWTAHRANQANGWSDNPLYQDMQKLASHYGLDVSFIRQAAKQRYVLPESAEIFTKPPGYYDVIIFGDSSLVWSFSPQIVAQVSGKKVAFLGYEGALPNKTFLPFATQICDVYLKRNGLALFLFDYWFVDPNAAQYEEAQRLVQVGTGSLWRQTFERAANAIFSLPRLALYSEAIEPFFAPCVYRSKHKGAANGGCAVYSWGVRAQALFMHCAADNGEEAPQLATTINLADTIVRGCDGVADPAIRANLENVAGMAVQNKVIVVPFHASARSGLVCEARRFKERLKVMNLPELAVERYGVTTLEFQHYACSHLANASSIPSSYVLGEVLKEMR
jgi:hypothetical protein